MNVLIVGGAGYVGSILQPALEQAHTCRYLDLRPVPGAEDRTVIGNLNNADVITEAVKDQHALLYLAMGSREGQRRTVNEIDPAFDVNVRDFYRTLVHALAAGVERICYASSLSVYYRMTYRPTPFDENEPADCWNPYGMSKRVGEFLCQAAAQQYPDATFLALRLMHPRNEQEWSPVCCHAAEHPNQIRTGPNDVRRLFLRALQFDRPGCHIVHASGDFTNKLLPNRRAHELLGWLPQNT